MKLKFLLLYLGAGFLGLLTFIILGTILPFKAKASSPDDISVAISPENPAPNDNTTITLSSYTDDLNSVMISWSVNGKKTSSGIGQKTFSINAPALGKKITVVATISLFDGDLNETAVIEPVIMTMLWQTDDSYVPPFYKGKAMPSPDSEIKVVAIPEIKSGSGFIDPNKMTYDWQLDETSDENNSGYGKNSYIYTSDYLDGSNNVSVTATTLDQKTSTEGSLDVTTTTPKIEFYQDDPTLGTIWEHALSDGTQITADEIVQAAPYFIAPKDLNIPFLTFTWSINGDQIDVPTYSKNLMPLTIQTGTSGSSKIGLEVDNVHSLVDTASKEINVNF
jgi:hypothetical protein